MNKRAIPNLTVDRLIPDVPAPQRALIEPYLDTCGAQTRARSAPRPRHPGRRSSRKRLYSTRSWMTIGTQLPGKPEYTSSLTRTATFGPAHRPINAKCGESQSPAVAPQRRKLTDARVAPKDSGTTVKPDRFRAHPRRFRTPHSILSDIMVIFIISDNIIKINQFRVTPHGSDQQPVHAWLGCNARRAGRARGISPNGACRDRKRHGAVCPPRVC